MFTPIEGEDNQQVEWYKHQLEVGPPHAINCYEKIAPLIFRHNLLRAEDPTRRSPALPVNFSDLA